MKTNTIITIGRQYGSGGKEIGHFVAEAFGIKLYDKEMLARAAKESGICEELFETHDEKPTNSFLYSLVMDTYSMGYAGNTYTEMPINHKVFLAQFDAIKKIADEGPCVLVGRCADYALESYPNVVSIFIRADMEDRIRRVATRLDLTDAKAKETKMNYTLLATPAEGLSGRFLRMDQKRYGKIPGVTDREYYTNSFHIPVWYPISAYEKIRKEAPYHALSNGGHISYVELDGDTAKNVEAFESVIRCMHDAGIGYGSVNHPVDRDPACGYVGVIDDVCPRCGRREGEPISDEKLKELRKLYPEMPQFCGCR